MWLSILDSDQAEQLIRSVSNNIRGLECSLSIAIIVLPGLFEVLEFLRISGNSDPALFYEFSTLLPGCLELRVLEFRGAVDQDAFCKTVPLIPKLEELSICDGGLSEISSLIQMAKNCPWIETIRLAGCGVKLRDVKELNRVLFVNMMKRFDGEESIEVEPMDLPYGISQSANCIARLVQRRRNDRKFRNTETWKYVSDFNSNRDDELRTLFHADQERVRNILLGMIRHESTIEEPFAVHPHRLVQVQRKDHPPLNEINELDVLKLQRDTSSRRELINDSASLSFDKFRLSQLAEEKPPSEQIKSERFINDTLLAPIRPK